MEKIYGNITTLVRQFRLGSCRSYERGRLFTGLDPLPPYFLGAILCSQKVIEKPRSFKRVLQALEMKRERLNIIETVFSRALPALIVIDTLADPIITQTFYPAISLASFNEIVIEQLETTYCLTATLAYQHLSLREKVHLDHLIYNKASALKQLYEEITLAQSFEEDSPKQLSIVETAITEYSRQFK